jgi:hypothetical protein
MKLISCVVAEVFFWISYVYEQLSKCIALQFSLLIVHLCALFTQYSFELYQRKLILIFSSLEWYITYTEHRELDMKMAQ